MRIDRILFTAALLVAIGATSCQRDTASTIDNVMLPTDPQEAVVRVRIASEALQETKSDKFSEEDVSRINNVVVYAVESSTGAWKRAFIPSATAGSALAEFSFFQGSEITLYAVANMGDVSFPLNDQGKLLPEQFAYDIPNNADLAASGVPMAKKIIIPSSEFVASNMTNSTASWGTGRVKELTVEMPLERLMARVVVGIDKSDLTGGVDTPVLTSATIAIRQANRHLCPFSESGSYARTVDDLFTGTYSVFDVDSFADSPDAMSHSGVVLYVPENRQGVLPYLDFQQTIPTEMPEGKAALCTFIEYVGTKDGSADGVGGDVCYRGFLGSKVFDNNNETLLFSVERNTTYNASLSLTWDGLVWDADGWRIDGTDVSDDRRLVLSVVPETAVPVPGNSLGKLRRQAVAGVFVNFSRDAGSSWVHSVKDIDDWPYGWEFYIDGEKQTGTNGTAAGQIGWLYAAASDEVRIRPAADAPMNTSHTLQVKSVDGKVVSNIVSFEVSAPLGLQWQTSAPTYVAQRGKLVPTELEDPSAEVVYTITSGDTKVRLGSSGDDQTKMVNLIGAGSATIHAECEATGQSDDISVTVTAPTININVSQLYANPDGAEARSGATGLTGNYTDVFYSGELGDEELYRVTATSTSTALGDSLAADLYDELLAFTPSVDSPLLRTSCASGYGTITIHAYKLNYGGAVYPSTAGVAIGTLSVAAKVAETGVEPESVTVYSVNPFTLYPSSVSLDTTKDIHDFSVIGFSSYNNWGGGYSETTYTTSFPTTRAGNAYVGLEAFMNGYYEPKLTHVFSGTPGATVSWSSITQARDTEHTAGVVSLKASVKNRYSQQLVYSPIFYQCRLFRHGAVAGYEDPAEQLDPSEQWTVNDLTYVSVKHYLVGAPYATSEQIHVFYPEEGLGCAIPDIGTHRASGYMDIEWSNYESHMEGLDGWLNITVNTADRPVKQTESSYLYKIEDVCYNSHLGLITSVCHEGLAGSPQMFFYASDNSSSKYMNGSVIRINENLAYLHPLGTPTTTVSSRTVGYFVLHTYQYVMNPWL